MITPFLKFTRVDLFIEIPCHILILIHGTNSSKQAD